MAKTKNDSIYEAIDNGGDVLSDIADLSFDEMEDYFGDTDPAEYL